MASSIIGGLLTDGFDPNRIRAAARSESTLSRLQKLGLGAIGSDNRSIVEPADVIVLAVKPQIIGGVCEELAASVRTDQLVISVAAGITVASLRGWLGEGVPVARCMPNTPALLGAGATGLYADDSIAEQHRAYMETIMRAAGAVRWVKEESLLHAVTAISGSGSAYFFQFMQAMIVEGVRMGLDDETARTLCAQTCIGAGRMLAEGELDAGELMDRVCSPRGTTERAVAVFKERGLAESVSQAMRDCHARSVEMSQELS